MSNARQKLIDLATSLAKFAEDNEKISLPFFAVKLSKAQQAYPEDHTIGMMSMVVGRMANSDKLLISRAEIKDLYEKFYTRNSKFASVFNDELGVAEIKETLVAAPAEYNANLIQETLDNAIDPVLASALDKAFGGSGVKEYRSSLAKQAVISCNNAFKYLGLDVKSEVVCGQGDVVVCTATFETPRGSTSVLVPVEMSEGRVVAPSVFAANHGTSDISKQNIVGYLTSRAGEKLNIRAEEVLQAALLVKNADGEISDVDLAVIKLNSQNTQEQFMAPQVLGVELETVNPNLVLNLPKIEDPHFESIAKTFDSELGFANFKFGSLLKKASSLLEQNLSKFGLSNFTIAVASSDNNSVTYSVGLNGGAVAFKVPVVLEANCVLPPSVLICNGSIKSFDRASVQSLLKEEGFDRGAALSASPLYGSKPSQLVNIVREAMADENYVRAEDALNILSQSDDERAYQVALTVFARGLKPSEEIAEKAVSKCSMVVKSAHSQHDLCGHTGLPLHKVYQDNTGNCIKQYRRDMAESYEGASFMNSKVYL